MTFARNKFDPTTAATPEEFVGLLRKVRAASGLSYRRIQRMAEVNGIVLPHSTLASMLTRDTLPRPDYTRALLQACGVGKPEIACWIEVLSDLRARQADATPAAQPVPAAVTVPRQLPPVVAGFYGRSGESDLLTAARDRRLAVITGAPGVGKTALAVRWSHACASLFPDGQLFMNLNGFGPSDPVSAHDAMASVIRALGIAGDQIPAAAEERVSFYRTVLAGQRVLLVADNARSPEHVRPLIPASGGSMIVVTSRDEMSELVALDGAARVRLAPFTSVQSLELLRMLLGLNEDPSGLEGARRIAGLCGGLPLALRLAAERASRQTGDLGVLLGDDRMFDAGTSAESAVRAAFSWSFESLEPPQARLFRLLSLHVGTDFDVTSAANLAGLPVPECRRLLAELLAANLLSEAAAGRYEMHDLLKEYARECCERVDPAAERSAALERLIAGLGLAARAAMDVIAPERRQIPVDDAEGNLSVPAFDGYGEALAWLETHRGALIAAIRHAARWGPEEQSWLIAHTLWRYFMLRRHTDDWISSHEVALTAARKAGDRRAEAEVLLSLATVYTHTGQSAEAIERYKSVLPLTRELLDKRGEATALGNLGTAYHRIGRYREAKKNYEAALQLLPSADTRDRALLVGNLGSVSHLLHEYNAAFASYQKALNISLRINDQNAEAYARQGLGTALRELGRLDGALAELTAALELARQRADSHDEASVLSDLGLLEVRRGCVTSALAQLNVAADIAAGVGDPNLTAMVLCRLGTALNAAGHWEDAIVACSESVTLATAANDMEQLAAAHAELSRAYRGNGDNASALAHRRRAIAVRASLRTGARRQA